PVEHCGASIIAVTQSIARERPVFLLIAGCEVPTSKLERIDVELARESVDGTLQRERSLDVTGRAKGRHGRRVHVREALHRPDVRARVHLVKECGRGALPTANTQRHVSLTPDRGETAVASRASRHTLKGRRSVAGVSLFDPAVLCSR